MHFIISHNSFADTEVVGFVCFDFFEKRGVKVVNMDYS